MYIPLEHSVHIQDPDLLGQGEGPLKPKHNDDISQPLRKILIKTDPRVNGNRARLDTLK